MIQPSCSLLFTQNVLRTYVHTKIHTQKFTAPLLLTSKTWKQLRSSSIDNWINILWYSHTMEYYSAIKRNDPSSHKTWKELIHTYLLLQLYCCNCWQSATHKTIETVTHQLVPEVCGKEGEKGEWMEHRGFSKQWNYSVWYNYGCITWHLSKCIQFVKMHRIIQCREWTLM